MNDRLCAALSSASMAARHRKMATQAGVDAELLRISHLDWPRARGSTNQDMVTWAQQALGYRELPHARRRPALAFTQFANFHDDRRRVMVALLGVRVCTAALVVN